MCLVRAGTFSPWINDILDLSKIEAGRMELQLESFSLASLIASVVKTIEALTAKNANQVAVDCDGGTGTLHADQMRLRPGRIPGTACPSALPSCRCRCRRPRW